MPRTSRVDDRVDERLDEAAGDGRIVVVYERVSSVAQDISRQAVQRDRARADNPDREIIVIQDDGVSAFKVPIFDRPGGKRLCAFIEVGGVAALYTDAQDRLSRGKQSEWWNFADLCELGETRIVIDGRELRLGEDSDEIRSALDAIIARRESRDKSHRVRGGKRVSAQKGRRNGGPRPYGYLQRNGVLTVLPAERGFLRRIRDEVVSGRSNREIALALNADGVRTVTGAAWSQTRVSQMLRNRLYIGKVRHRDAEFDGNHEAIFTEAEWIEVQDVLTSRRRGPGGGRGRRPRMHLLSGGMLRCGRCGATMIPRSTTNSQGRRYETYRCAGRVYGSSPDCIQPTVRREKIDEAIFGYVVDVGIDLDASRRAILVSADSAAAATQAALAAAEREAITTIDLARRVLTEWAEGGNDRPSLPFVERLVNEYEEQQAAAEAKVERLQLRLVEIAAESRRFDAEEELLRWIADLRAAVAGHVRQAGDLAGVRVALSRLYSGFTLHSYSTQPPEPQPAPPDGWVRSRDYAHPALLLSGGGGFLIEPHPRRDVILDYDPESPFPELRRIPIGASVGNTASRR